MHPKPEWINYPPGRKPHHESRHQLLIPATTVSSSDSNGAWCVRRNSRLATGSGIGALFRSRFSAADDDRVTSSKSLIGPFNYRQSSFIVVLLSSVFAASIVCHELAVEGGLDVQNYVAVAFCVVWFLVNTLLFIGSYLKAPFLLIPWMILMVALMPIFFVAILVGSSVIHRCMHHNDAESCQHEYHMFGTTDHVIASVKLALVAVVLAINTLSACVIYQFYRLLNKSSTVVPLSLTSTPSGEWLSSDSLLYQPASSSSSMRGRLSNFAVVRSGGGTQVLRHHSIIRRSESCDSQTFLPLSDNNSFEDNTNDEINTTTTATATAAAGGGGLQLVSTT